ncbi:MAG: hypothetical protein SF029_19555 [bacterium]|nr:hypothetical protein [bacterium]
MPLPDFRDANEPIGNIGTIGDFWRWAMSDLIGNRNRGILAEFMVGKLLGADFSHPRLEWDCYDLEYRGYRIEVKSSSTLQSWHTSPDQRSTLSFGIATHGCWDARTNSNNLEKKRHAHLYVFCVFPMKAEATPADVLNLDQWQFYATTTQHLEAHFTPEIAQTTAQIGIARVRAICGDALSHTQLKPFVDHLLESM